MYPQLRKLIEAWRALAETAHPHCCAIVARTCADHLETVLDIATMHGGNAFHLTAKDVEQLRQSISVAFDNGTCSLSPRLLLTLGYKEDDLIVKSRQRDAESDPGLNR